MREVFQWGMLVLFVAFMAFVGLMAGIVVNMFATLLLDPTCSRGLCDSDLFAPYKLLTIWLPMLVVAAIGTVLVWRAGGRS